MFYEEKDNSNTSKRIETAALSLISQFGYANVSMRDIAKEAGVALSQINYHYKSKEGLFIALIRHVKNSLLEDISSRMKNTKTSQERIDFLCSYARESIVNDLAIHRLHLDFSNLALWSETFRAEYKCLIQELCEVIAEYIRDDAPMLAITRKHTPEQTAHFIIAFILGVSTQYLADGGTEETLSSLDFLKNVLGEEK